MGDRDEGGWVRFSRVGIDGEACGLGKGCIAMVWEERTTAAA